MLLCVHLCEVKTQLTQSGVHWSQLICKWKPPSWFNIFDVLWFQQQDRGGVASQDHRRNCSSEFNKLLKTIQGVFFAHGYTREWIVQTVIVQSYAFYCLSLSLFSSTLAGIPPLADHAPLELTVAYNACVASLAHAQFSEAELRLKHAMQRGRKSSAVVKASLRFCFSSSSLFCSFLVAYSPAEYNWRTSRFGPPCVLENSPPVSGKHISEVFSLASAWSAVGSVAGQLPDENHSGISGAVLFILIVTRLVWWVYTVIFQD